MSKVKIFNCVANNSQEDLIEFSHDEYIKPYIYYCFFFVILCNILWSVLLIRRLGTMLNPQDS